MEGSVVIDVDKEDNESVKVASDKEPENESDQDSAREDVVDAKVPVNTDSSPNSQMGISSKFKGNLKKKNKGNQNANNNQKKFPNKSNTNAASKNNNKIDKGTFIYPLLNCTDSSGNSSNGNKNSGNNNANFGMNREGFMKHVLSMCYKFCRNTRVYPMDSWFLFLYYRIGVFLFHGLFLNSWAAWYFKDPIHCINVDADAAPFNLSNICLSYIYVEESSGKRFLPFYRWIPYSCLLIGALFYVPRLLIKTQSPRLQTLLTNLHEANKWNWFDSKITENKMGMICMYLKKNFGTHKILFTLFILNHLLAVSLSFLAVLFFDFNLQGLFLFLPHRTYPFERDLYLFKDELSRTFPPFAKCTIDKAIGITNERTECFACHLTYMELYEKMFLFLWFFLFILIVLGLLYSVTMLFIVIIPVKNYVLHTNVEPKGWRNLKNFLLKKLDVGDIFVLLLMKRYLSDLEFFNVLENLKMVIVERKQQELGSDDEPDAPDYPLTNSENWKYHHSSTPKKNIYFDNVIEKERADAVRMRNRAVSPKYGKVYKLNDLFDDC